MFELWAAEENFIIRFLSDCERGKSNQDKIDALSLQDLIGDEKPIYEIEGDTATVNIFGVLTQSGLSILERIFGYEGTAYDDLLLALDDIASRKDVTRVNLMIDSPGGEASGVDEVWQKIFSMRGEKEIVAYNKGLIASAAYWIASAASKIVATSPTNETGSIGVIITAIDASAADEAMGVKFVRVISKNAPEKYADVATESGIDILQKRVDALERIFIDRIASGRGVSAGKVKNDFGRGGVMVAYDPEMEQPSALAVGMIDFVVGILSGNAGKPVVPSGIDGARISDLNDNLIKYAKESVDIQGDYNLKFATDVVPTNELVGEKQEQEKGQTMADQRQPEQIEGENKIKEAFEKGFIHGQELLRKTIEKASGFLASESYPASIKNLALKVLRGEAESAALDGAAAVVDFAIEAQASEEAAAKSLEAGDIKRSADVAITANGVINNEHDFKAAVGRIKVMQGRV